MTAGLKAISDTPAITDGELDAALREREERRTETLRAFVEELRALQGKHGVVLVAEHSGPPALSVRFVPLGEQR